MKKMMMLASVPAMFTLAACGETASEDAAETETAAMDDDNDAPEPEPEVIPEGEEHDESVPHAH